MHARFDALAHLLRHLHDGAALRANPIAARYFSPAAGSATAEDVEAEALARVRAAISAAVEHVFIAGPDEQANVHSRRQRTIIERCDLRREPHALVAADLGLSRREFYRERKRACGPIAEYLAHVDLTDPARSLPDEFDLTLTFAESLCRLGRHDAAIASMETLGARRFRRGKP